MQVDEQPSPLLVFPSSHASLTTNPSPHFEVHRPVAAPQFGSAWQVGEQPSLGRVLPSSQPSEPSTLPSPHTVWWQLRRVAGAGPAGIQLAGGRARLAPCSSPGTPGSHCSMGASTMPSPQSGTHGALVKGQAYPVSIVQVDEQPSPLLGVAVVALLAALDHAVAALDDRTDAQLAWGANAARAFGLAVGRAPVAVLLVAVVAHFAERGLDDAVTAPRGRLAGIAGRRADPTSSRAGKCCCSHRRYCVLPSSQFSPGSMRLLPHWEMRVQGCPAMHL